MSNLFTRQAARFNNEMARSCGALIGIAQGMLADGSLNDAEIVFLSNWLQANESIANAWPGNVIYDQARAILADGRVTEEERTHLFDVLQRLIGGALEEVANTPQVTQLAVDDVDMVQVSGRRFCLTGDFAYGARGHCERLIEERGGEVSSAVSKRVHYVVVGGLGSPEWKHGSFGTKIAKAMELKQQGAPLLIVHEDAWVAAIRS